MQDDDEQPVSIRDLLWQVLSAAIKPGPLQEMIVSAGVENPIVAIKRAEYVESQSRLKRVTEVAGSLALTRTQQPGKFAALQPIHLLAALLDCEPDYVASTLALSAEQMADLTARCHTALGDPPKQDSGGL